jgi:hypothetical protein
MANINDVPLPYHTRVGRFISETAEVEMEQLTELGNWVRFKVDESQFRALSGGTDAFFTEFNQDWDDYTDELWVPDAEREYQEMQSINEAYPEPVFTTATEHWAREMLKQADQNSAPEKIIFRRYSSGTEEEDSQEGEAASRSDTHGTGHYLAQRPI